MQIFQLSKPRSPEYGLEFRLYCGVLFRTDRKMLLRRSKWFNHLIAELGKTTTLPLFNFLSFWSKLTHEGMAYLVTTFLFTWWLALNKNCEQEKDGDVHTRSRDRANVLQITHTSCYKLTRYKRFNHVGDDRPLIMSTRGSSVRYGRVCRCLHDVGVGCRSGSLGELYAILFLFSCPWSLSSQSS